MCQYVVKIDNDRPTPISIEECSETGVEVGRYDVCFLMAIQARRIQRRQVKDIRNGKLDVRSARSPIILSMEMTRDYA